MISIQVEQYMARHNIENAELDMTACRKNRKGRILCPIRCKEGFEPAWSYKRDINIVFSCPSKTWVFLNPKKSKITGTPSKLKIFFYNLYHHFLACVESSYKCDASEADAEFPIANGNWSCRSSATGLNCSPRCNAADTVRYRIKCEESGINKGWSVSTHSEFRNLFWKFLICHMYEFIFKK